MPRSRDVSAPRDGTRAALIVGIAGAASVVVYAVVRAVERLALHEPNPAALVWSERSPFFWRVVIAAYAAGAAAFGAYALARAAPRAAARLLVALVVVATVAALTQGAFLP